MRKSIATEKPRISRLFCFLYIQPQLFDGLIFIIDFPADGTYGPVIDNKGSVLLFLEHVNNKFAILRIPAVIQKTNNETLPVFNHVLRAALTNMEGDPIAPAVAEAGERSFDFEVSLNNGWDSQNCEFVIYVFKEEEDAAFIVNNGAVCPVGGKVDYKYESVE
jgi:hypothetical protein